MLESQEMFTPCAGKRRKSVKVTKENTVIVDGAGSEEAVAERIRSIRRQEELSAYDKQKDCMD